MKQILGLFFLIFGNLSLGMASEMVEIKVDEVLREGAWTKAISLQDRVIERIEVRWRLDQRDATAKAMLLLDGREYDAFRDVKGRDWGWQTEDWNYIPESQHPKDLMFFLGDDFDHTTDLRLRIDTVRIFYKD